MKRGGGGTTYLMSIVVWRAAVNAKWRCCDGMYERLSMW